MFGSALLGSTTQNRFPHLRSFLFSLKARVLISSFSTWLRYQVSTSLRYALCKTKSLVATVAITNRSPSARVAKCEPRCGVAINTTPHVRCTNCWSHSLPVSLPTFKRDLTSKPPRLGATKIIGRLPIPLFTRYSSTLPARSGKAIASPSPVHRVASAGKSSVHTTQGVAVLQKSSKIHCGQYAPCWAVQVDWADPP